MKTRTCLLVIVLLLGNPAKAQNGCGFQFNLTNTGSANCFGYAMALGVGYNGTNNTQPATYFNEPSMRTEYFSIAGGSYKVGDIIVFGRFNVTLENVTQATGHAVYVSAILAGNKPDNLLKVSANGVWSDDDPITDPDNNVICDQVLSDGGSEAKGVKLGVVRSQRPLDEIKGFYRLRSQYKCTLTFKNVFPNNDTTSQINVGRTLAGTFLNRESPFPVLLARNAVIDAQALNPNKDNTGVSHTFSQWKRGQQNFSSDTNITAQVATIDETYKAVYGTQITVGDQVSFENKAGSYSFGSIIKVEGQDKLSPTPDYDAGANAVAYQTLFNDDVTYTFQYWSPGGSNPSITPTTAGRYIAYYSGTPSSIDFLISTDEEYHIALFWSDHPNTNVTQYQIWRKVTPYGGSPGSPTLIATVGRGEGGYVDYQYYFTDNHLHKTIGYDVRPYFQPTGTYADANWKYVFGNTYLDEANKGEDENAELKTGALENGFETYPNPFNPSVQLNYQLKENSNVHILIHDMLGRLVMELVNADQSAGRYSQEWDARNKASGIYFASFIVSPVSGKPFVVTKKLVLAK